MDHTDSMNRFPGGFREPPAAPSSKNIDLEDNLSTLDHQGDVNVDLRGRPSELSKTGTWKTAPFIYGLAGGDSFAAFGVMGNLVFFLVGTLGFEIAKAATMTTNFVGTMFVVTIAWGFFADAYLGKFLTASLGGVIQMIGAAVMTVTVSRHHLLPVPCQPSPFTPPCPTASSKFMTPFNVGLYLLAVGSGGVKSSVAAFGADQFDESQPSEKKDEPRYFNFLYLALQIGTVGAVTLITYILISVSNTAGFAVITAGAVAALFSFWLGIPFFRHKLPSGSAFTRIAQVLVAAFRNRKEGLPPNPDQLYEVTSFKGSAIRGSRKIKHTHNLRFFDKAAIVTYGSQPATLNPWKTTTVTQVEEFKRVILMIPIWLTGCIVYTLFAQFTSFTIQQAATMDRYVGKLHVPPSSIGAVSLVGVIVLVPIYDGVFVPIARRITGHPQGITTLQRIGAGLIVSILAMVTAAVVEHKRVDKATEAAVALFLKTGRLPGPGFVIPMSAYWLVPQYFLIAVTELLTTVGQLEFFYGEAPDGMRNIAISYYFTSFAIGNFLSTALVNLTNKVTKHGHKGSWLKDPYVNQGGLANFYYLLAVIVSIDLVFYLVFAYLYKYKEVEESKDETTSELSMVEH